MGRKHLHYGPNYLLAFCSRGPYHECMTYTPPFPDAGSDVIDSRDVIWHIADLESDLADARDEGDDLAVADILQQLKPLQDLAEEGENLSDWSYGVQMIEDSYFEDYARQFAEDIGAITGDETWPACHIDWKEAAESLQMDYTPIEYDGHTYWAR